MRSTTPAKVSGAENRSIRAHKRGEATIRSLTLGELRGRVRVLPNKPQQNSPQKSSARSARPCMIPCLPFALLGHALRFDISGVSAGGCEFCFPHTKLQRRTLSCKIQSGLLPQFQSKHYLLLLLCAFVRHTVVLLCATFCAPALPHPAATSHLYRLRPLPFCRRRR